MHSTVPPQIPGHKLEERDADYFKEIVAGMLSRDSKRFPGAQPVSFAREHISELQHSEYFMCEKTDGVRCLLFLYFREVNDGFEPVTFLIDRKNHYYEVSPPLRFPYYLYPNDEDKFLFNTILDGELVHDKVSGSPKPRLMFYVFDCLVFDQEPYTGRPLDKRIGKMKAQLFQPYEHWLQRHPQHNRYEPFRVKEKTVYPPYHVKNMFEHVLPALPHGNDGLIFTCKNTGYTFGTDQYILKWKPPHENTIDFKLKLGAFPTFDPEDGVPGEIDDYDAMPNRFELHIMHDRNKYQRFEHDLQVTPEEWEKLKSLNQRLDGRIIECYRATDGQWKFKREDDGTPRWRDDKKDANHISTVRSVLESIEDPVTIEDLIRAEPKVKAAVYRLRADEQQAQKEALERDVKKRKLSEMNGH